jgi:hypothetical protein
LDIELGKQRLAQFEVVGLVEHIQETLFCFHIVSAGRR